MTLLWLLFAQFLIFVPMCFSSRHWGTTPLSPQYSSIDVILPSTIRIKEVAWKESSFVLAEYMSSNHDMGICGNDPLYLTIPFAGIFTVRPNEFPIRWKARWCYASSPKHWNGNIYGYRLRPASEQHPKTFLCLYLLSAKTIVRSTSLPSIYVSDRRFFCNISLSILAHGTLFRFFVTVLYTLRFHIVESTLTTIW